MPPAPSVNKNNGQDESSNVEKVVKIVSETNVIVENKPFLSDNMKKLSVLLNKYIEQDMGKYLNSHQF